jgi:hypothetical protein
MMSVLGQKKAADTVDLRAMVFGGMKTGEEKYSCSILGLDSRRR